MTNVFFFSVLYLLQFFSWAPGNEIYWSFDLNGVLTLLVWGWEIFIFSSIYKVLHVCNGLLGRCIALWCVSWWIIFMHLVAANILILHITFLLLFEFNICLINLILVSIMQFGNLVVNVCLLWLSSLKNILLEEVAGVYLEWSMRKVFHFSIIAILYRYAYLCW